MRTGLPGKTTAGQRVAEKQEWAHVGVWGKKSTEAEGTPRTKALKQEYGRLAGGTARVAEMRSHRLRRESK